MKEFNAGLIQAIKDAKWLIIFAVLLIGPYIHNKLSEPTFEIKSTNKVPINWDISTYTDSIEFSEDSEYDYIGEEEDEIVNKLDNLINQVEKLSIATDSLINLKNNK